jgi:hypothetical protein
VLAYGNEIWTIRWKTERNRRKQRTKEVTGGEISRNKRKYGMKA